MSDSVEQRKPLIIGIGGGTASGKSTIVRGMIGQVGADSAVGVSLDWYYHDQSSLPPDEREAVNYDHPTAIDFQSLQRDLRLIAEGHSITVPKYDFVTHSRTGAFTVLPRPIVLVEGVLVLFDPEVRRSLDIKVFIEANSDLRLARRLQRDVKERGQLPASVKQQYQDYCTPMHAKYVEPSRLYADLVVRNEGVVTEAIDRIRERIYAAAKRNATIPKTQEELTTT